MKAVRIETWVWALIYAGIVIGGVGLAVLRRDTSLGWSIAAAGTLLVVAGATLGWVRSRMTDDNHKPPTEKAAP